MCPLVAPRLAAGVPSSVTAGLCFLRFNRLFSLLPQLLSLRFLLRNIHFPTNFLLSGLFQAIGNKIFK